MAKTWVPDCFDDRIFAGAGDDRTIKDLLVFLVRWMDRHPSYRGRPFFITGESYAGASTTRERCDVHMITDGSATTFVVLQHGELGHACRR